MCLQKSLERHGVNCTTGDGALPVGVTWDLVASDVKTRTANQCRYKW